MASIVRTIHDIYNDRDLTYEGRALECLLALETLAWNDQAKDEYRTAAQVFAALAVAEASRR